MSTSLNTAADFRKQLEANLRIRSNQTGENIHRLRQKVAFDRLLARLFTQEPSSFFLKGGYAMELHVSHARATKDIDLTFSRRGVSTKDPLSELIVQELQLLSRVNLNDHFSYRIGPAQQDIENAPYGGSRHSVTAVIANRIFVEFHLDVGGDVLVDPPEKVSGSHWLEFYGIQAPIISVISVPQQFAEKLHSYTLPRTQVNTRAKDLIDLILLLSVKPVPPEAFQRALRRVFKIRNTHSLPSVLDAPPASWQKPFETMAAECGVPQSLEAGFVKVSDFYNSLQALSLIGT